jgi:hypothetical protein
MADNFEHPGKMGEDVPAAVITRAEKWQKINPHTYRMERISRDPRPRFIMK